MLDKMYLDFNERLLPAVQEGIQITKDYFLDLFTRYAHYLLLTDILEGIIWLIVGIVAVVVLRKTIKRMNTKGFDFTTEMDFFAPIIVAVMSLVIIFSLMGIHKSATNAIKAKFIPEVRVYEELQSMRPSNNN